jgi:hypothetical protein
MAGHLEDIRQMTSSTKEVLDFYVNAIKATPENEGMLVLAGVQQRHKAEITGSMCGARKSIASPVDFAEVDLVHQAVAASDAQQGIGRLRCRQVVAGKAKPVRIFICHRDSRDQQFKGRLLRAFPRATWTDQASENGKLKSQAYQVSRKIGESLEVTTGGSLSHRQSFERGLLLDTKP